MDILRSDSANDNLTPEKRCTGPCGRMLPATPEFFTRQKKGKYGFKAQCKVCRHEKDKAYESRSDIRLRKHLYTKAHRLRSGVNERRRSYDHKRDALKKDVLGTHTAEQIQDLLKRQKYRCYYTACGHAKFEKRDGKYIYHIDHTFPISRVVGTDIPANDISYLVLACPHCNMSKNDKYPWEFFEGGKLL